MSNLTDEQIRGLLVDFISDGFNRSLNALEQAGALDTRKLRAAYTGMGSKYYDLVTEQIGYTAQFGVAQIRRLIDDSASSGNS